MFDNINDSITFTSFNDYVPWFKGKQTKCKKLGAYSYIKIIDLIHKTFIGLLLVPRRVVKNISYDSYIII